MIRGESSIKNIKSHLEQGEWSQVINICQQEIDSSSKIPSTQVIIDCYTYMARAYTQQGKIDLAVNAYQKILSVASNKAEIYAELGLLYSKRKDPSQAAWHYREALKLRPKWAELHYNLGVILHQLGNWHEAIATYNQAITIKPDYAAAYFNLGVLYDQKGELESAIAAYQEVIAKQPNLARAYSNLGSTFARQREYAKAIAIFKQGISLNPTWATLHNNLGQIYWFEDQLGLALKSFETAIILDPKMSLAHHNLGRLWQHQSNYPQAAKCLQTVTKLEPENILAYSNYADVQQQLGNLASTLDCWQKIIKQFPDFVTAYCQRQLASRPQDLLETAKLSCARFLQALQQEQTTEAYDHLWRTYSYMGDVLFEFGGMKQAEIYYQQALQIKPQNPELYLKLGNCLTRQQRLDAAVTVYKLGLLFQPENPQICFQLGKILERTQEPEQAIDFYETVLNQELEPAPDWETLPKLFPPEDIQSLLPTRIYHQTQDWVRDCDLEDFNYIQIVWSQEQSATARMKSAGQSAVIKTNPTETSPLDCGGVNCNKCMDKLIKQFKPMQIGQDAYRCSLEQAPNIPARLPFVVTIPEGRAWIAPQKNSWVICNALAVMTPDNYLLGDLSRDYPWFLPGCPVQERESHKIFAQQTIPPLEKITGKVALLSGLAGHVYYHWMFDIIPRWELLRQSGIEFKDIDWFVVNSLSKPFQKETLRLLGIDPNKIIESDRTSHIQATELIVPSFPGYLDWVPEGTIKFLRQAFLSQVSVAKTSKQKIYVSRARAKNRQLINEEEVSEFLTQEGFTTVFLEEMSFLEQVAVFVNASTIVAPHGSGLTNLVFCSPNTKVVELFSPNYLRTDYWMISQQLHLQHYYTVGKNFDCLSLRNLMYQNALTEDILVNIDALKLILQHSQQKD